MVPVRARSTGSMSPRNWGYDIFLSSIKILQSTDHSEQTGRTPVDCMRHAVVRKAHSWTPEADRRLLEAVGIYGTDNWSLGRLSCLIRILPFTDGIHSCALGFRGCHNCPMSEPIHADTRPDIEKGAVDTGRRRAAQRSGVRHRPQLDRCRGICRGPQQRTMPRSIPRVPEPISVEGQMDRGARCGPAKGRRAGWLRQVEGSQSARKRRAYRQYGRPSSITDTKSEP